MHAFSNRTQKYSWDVKNKPRPGFFDDGLCSGQDRIGVGRPQFQLRMHDRILHEQVHLIIHFKKTPKSQIRTDYCLLTNSSYARTLSSPLEKLENRHIHKSLEQSSLRW